MSVSHEASEAHKLLTPDELSQALKIDVFDSEGKTHTLGDLTKGRRTALVFVRHFWCVNCQAYLRHISLSIPPSNLLPDTQILAIGCGSYQPIKTYTAQSACIYPIYTDPTLRLHKIFGFKYNLAESKSGDEKRDYMKDAGGTMARVFGGIKGALGHLEHFGNTGPSALNGGEVVISAEGECEYIYRMQNTMDHTNVGELARLLGARNVEPVRGEQKQACEQACDVEAK